MTSKDQRSISLNEQRRIAYHEAGHAVIATILDVPFRSVSIVPTKRTLGRVNRTPTPLTAQDREQDALVRLAGSIAEERHTGWSNWQGALDDYAAVVRLLGSDEKLEALERRAKSLIQQHWPAVCAVTGALLIQQRLTYRQVLALVRPSGTGDWPRRLAA